MSTYPSKRAWWLMAILWSLALFMPYVAITVHREPVAPWMQVFATVFFVLQTALVWWLLMLAYKTRYCLDADNLTIRLGPFGKAIPLAQISEAYPTNNPLSAPAWSLDRLRIRGSFSRFGALISPVRRDRFLIELARLAPHLQYRDGQLVSKGAPGHGAAPRAGKTLGYRLFGAGKLPGKYADRLRFEGLQVLDEGVGGSITMRNFRGPGRIHTWKRNWFSGSLVWTGSTFAAFTAFRPLIYLPLSDPRLKQLQCRVDDDGVLHVHYDAALFNDRWSGRIELRFKTRLAHTWLDRLTAAGAMVLEAP